MSQIKDDEPIDDEEDGNREICAAILDEFIGANTGEKPQGDGDR